MYSCMIRKYDGRKKRGRKLIHVDSVVDGLGHCIIKDPLVVEF